MTHQLDSAALKSWFLAHRRALPWRGDPSPYAVWVSEVMLQQTQVAVVIPYFERWMQRFPTVESLATADVGDVIKLWEGLGYYSRARHLHAGAQHILKHFKGVIPETEEELRTIRGLGPYTVGAIRAFAFKHKASAVDGNVLRVLARHYSVQDPIDKVKTQRQLRLLADTILPDSEPWLITEGLIELGATVCRRQPLCELCPLTHGCQAYGNGTQEQLPKKTTKAAVQRLYRSVAVVKGQDGLLLRQCQKGEIMSDLHEFPYIETSENGIDVLMWEQILSLPLAMEYSMSSVEHTFTRFRARLDPVVFTSDSQIHVDGYQWHSWDEIPMLAFSSGHRRILKSILAERIA